MLSLQPNIYLLITPSIQYEASFGIKQLCGKSKIDQVKKIHEL